MSKFVSTCMRKARYGSFEEAEAMALKVMAERPDGRGSLFAYHCDYCDGWHFGHAKRPRFTSAPPPASVDAGVSNDTPSSGRSRL